MMMKRFWEKWRKGWGAALACAGVLLAGPAVSAETHESPEM